MKIATNRHGFSKSGEFGAMWRKSPRVKTLGQAGLGAAAAARRKSIALGLEERGRKERAAHWLLHTRGHRVLRRGHFMEE